MPVIGFGLPIYEMVDAYAFGTINEVFAAWWEFMPEDWLLKTVAHRGGPVDVNREFIAQALLMDAGDPGRAWTSPRCEHKQGPARGRVERCDECPDGQPAIRKSPMTGLAADVILWQDSDCFLQTGLDYRRLIQALLDAPANVGAIAVAFPMQEDGRPRPNVVGFDRGDNRKITFDGDIHDVEWAGFGCIATRAEVYRAVPRPWFKMGLELNDLTVDDVRNNRCRMVGPGEDSRWCVRAAEHGFITCVHTGMLGKHSFRRPQSIDEFQGSEEHRTC